MKSYLDIPGWCDYEETYQNIVSSQSGGIIVEVGCYLGRSLCMLGQLVQKSGKPFKIVGVDHCRGSGVENDKDNHIDAVKQGGGSFAGQLISNVIECGVQDVVSVIVADSRTAACFFRTLSVTAVFLDAQHSYEAVKQDIETWYPIIKFNGILAGDDVGVSNELDHQRVWPGVKKAVDEMLPEWVYSPHDCFLYTKR